MPQLDPTWYVSQLFWLAITFSVLYVVLAKLILPRLLGILGAREDAKAMDLSAADQFRKDAEHAKLQYEHAMSDARERAKSLFTDAETSIKKISANANKQLEEKMGIRMQEAEKTIDAKKQELKSYFDQHGSSMVMDIAAKMTGNTPSQIAADKAFKQANATL